MKSLLILVSLMSVNCAQTTFFRNGQKIAMFQGDMKDTDFYYSAAGDVIWKSSTVDHSSATIAQGKAAEGKINAIATAGTAAYLLK